MRTLCIARNVIFTLFELIKCNLTLITIQIPLGSQELWSFNYSDKLCLFPQSRTLYPIIIKVVLFGDNIYWPGLIKSQNPSGALEALPLNYPNWLK